MVDRDFIDAHTTEVTLRDGTRVRLRPVVPEDKAKLLQGFQRLSPESRYRRFHTGMSRLTPALLRYFTEVDYVNHFAWAALAIDEPDEPGIGVARYVRLTKDPQIADAAVTVADDYQGRGLGTMLLKTLSLTALENGVNRFRSYVLEENQPMINILKEAGAELKHDSPGVFRVDLDLPEEIALLRSTAMYEVLRAVARGEPPPQTRAWPLRRLFPRIVRRVLHSEEPGKEEEEDEQPHA
ncbi:MAG: GNAT family N-acetyltransferase [Actinomycetota bacterium]